MKPVSPSRVSQPFADAGSYASRKDVHGPAGHHTGVDLGSAWPIKIEGRTVRAVLPGEVVIDEYNSTMGNWVGVYNYDNDLLVTYWHMQKDTMWLPSWVQAFHVLGSVGSTGNSTAPHLHVQVNRGRTFDYHGHIDPERAFKVIGRAEARRNFRMYPKHPNA